MTTDITELALSLKAAAEKATQGNWRAFKYHDGRCGIGGGHHDEIMVCEHISKRRPHDAEFIALANPANILALVEALESEKRICATWRKTAKSTGEKLEKAQTINAAAEKLVRCKGRYHSEQNYRALAALFGVKTPDLPPLEHENVHYADAAEMEIAALRQRIAELEPFHTAYIEWSDKTAWVQTDKRFDVLKPWGKHRADVLKEYIQHLESRTVTMKQGEVLVTVAGFTGCGKSAIAGEIEIAMKAIGVPVTWANGDSEKRMTGADWLTAIEMYKPTVRIVEVNIPRAAGIKVGAE
ncbi:Ead domain protein [Klebsiella pneumoniae]|uniref:ead/Ea22-like family protein n=1 Tax=Klebsiella pneumoniae TaxID=573 RepID=UPI000808B6C6|nr:ead/Ea22-like family protein [Klebsiella pneumoniae]SBX72771.1 Ead domain protein [Klebsiella pneumoniae]